MRRNINKRDVKIFPNQRRIAELEAWQCVWYWTSKKKSQKIWKYSKLLRMNHFQNHQMKRSYVRRSDTWPSQPSTMGWKIQLEIWREVHLATRMIHDSTSSTKASSSDDVNNPKLDRLHEIVACSINDLTWSKVKSSLRNSKTLRGRLSCPLLARIKWETWIKFLKKTWEGEFFLKKVSRRAGKKIGMVHIKFQVHMILRSQQVV